MCLFDNKIDMNSVQKTSDLCEQEFNEWEQINQQFQIIDQFQIEFSDPSCMLLKIFNL